MVITKFLCCLLLRLHSGYAPLWHQQLYFANDHRIGLCLLAYLTESVQFGSYKFIFQANIEKIIEESKFLFKSKNNPKVFSCKWLFCKLSLKSYSLLAIIRSIKIICISLQCIEARMPSLQDILKKRSVMLDMQKET